MLAARPLSLLFSEQQHQGPAFAQRRPPFLARAVPSLRRTTEMVEGHGVHRVAAQHRKRLKGLRFTAVSPNGRFEEGAAAINEKVLRDVHAHGTFSAEIFLSVN